MTKKYKLLIVEDDEDIRELIEIAMTKELNFPLEISALSNAHEALQKCNDSQYDIIISDFKLPGMNGCELVRELRKSQNYSSTPVILISAYLTDSLFEENFDKADNVTFTSKPFDIEKLAMQIRVMLFS